MTCWKKPNYWIHSFITRRQDFLGQLNCLCVNYYIQNSLKISWQRKLFSHHTQNHQHFCKNVIFSSCRTFLNCITEYLYTLYIILHVSRINYCGLSVKECKVCYHGGGVIYFAFSITWEKHMCFQVVVVMIWTMISEQCNALSCKRFWIRSNKKFNLNSSVGYFEIARVILVSDTLKTYLS